MNKKFIEPEDVEEYYKIYDLIDAFKPNIFLILDENNENFINNLHKRIVKRNRPGEENINEDFLKQLHEEYQIFIKENFKKCVFFKNT